jgi:hypothetical protein
MLSELLSHLGQQEILFFVVVLSVTVIMIAQYIFKDSGEFGQPAESDLAPAEVKQLVEHAVEAQVAPLQQRIEALEEQQSRYLSGADAEPSPSESGPPAPPDDRS